MQFNEHFLVFAIRNIYISKIYLFMNYSYYLILENYIIKLF